jgi:hypothetical protein
MALVDNYLYVLEEFNRVCASNNVQLVFVASPRLLSQVL